MGNSRRRWRSRRSAPRPYSQRTGRLSGFHRIVERCSTHDSALRQVVSHDRLQCRACCGGLTGALAVPAMREKASGAWTSDVGLRALQTRFVGPMVPGSRDVQPQALRQGRNACQVQAHVHQAGQVVAVFA